MFTDWPSELIPQNGWGDEFSISALKDTIPWNVGRDFVAGTAKHLYEGLGLKKPKPAPESKIVHDKQLQIIMPAIGYGLSFPLNENEILRNCVYVYNEWLSALLPEPKQSVPKPILKDPNHYATIIIRHFYYLFVPRNTQAVDEINRQALLCHRVLRTLQDIAKNSPCLNEETWQTLLIFLLHINSALLSPPSVKSMDYRYFYCSQARALVFRYIKGVGSPKKHR